MNRTQVMEKQEMCSWHEAPPKVSLNVEEHRRNLTAQDGGCHTLMQNAAALHMMSISRTETAGSKAVSLVQFLRRQVKRKEVLGTHIQKLAGAPFVGPWSALHTIVLDMPSMADCMQSLLQAKNALILGSHQSS
jgi:hypothetical protein